MSKRNPLKMFSVEDQVIAATGGGGVLVGEMCRALASLGAKVAVLDIDPAAAERVAGEITGAGGQVLGLATDVLDPDSCRKAGDAIADRFGPVTALINGAGGNRPEATTSPELSFFDLPPDAIRAVFDLNFLGSLVPCQVFGRVMAQRKQGTILNLSSMNAFRPLTRIPAYSAAKAALSNFTQWLAVHMAQEYSTNIRVNALAPGFFLTDQNRFLVTDEKTGDYTPRGKTIVDHTPMGRLGEPSDLLGAVLWLLSPASAFVTGVVIPLDGGFSAYSGV
jgi:NAD(P)-dependent dehydrogenase (short-subunit alcohol dehydrogenase family)